MYPEQPPGQPPAAQPPPTGPLPPPGYPGAGYPPAGQPAPGYPPAGQPAPGYPPAGQPAPGYPTSAPASPGYPTSGPPTTGFPTSGFPTSGPPTSGSPALAGAPRRRVSVPLLVINGVLVLALIAAAAIVLTVLGGVHADTGTAKAQRDAKQTAQAQAKAHQRADFQQADLAGKLTQVRTLTDASQQALIKWDGLSQDQQSAQIHTVQDAINKCDLAIFDYDSTAAKFPASLVQAAGLPMAIDTTDSATDCGRID